MQMNENGDTQTTEVIAENTAKVNTTAETTEPAETPAPAETTEPAEIPAPAETTEPAEIPAPAESAEPAETPAPAEATEVAENASPAETPAPAEKAEEDEEEDEPFPEWFGNLKIKKYIPAILAAAAILAVIIGFAVSRISGNKKEKKKTAREELYFWVGIANNDITTQLSYDAAIRAFEEKYDDVDVVLVKIPEREFLGRYRAAEKGQRPMIMDVTFAPEEILNDLKDLGGVLTEDEADSFTRKLLEASDSRSVPLSATVQVCYRTSATEEGTRMDSAEDFIAGSGSRCFYGDISAYDDISDALGEGFFLDENETGTTIYTDRIGLLTEERSARRFLRFLVSEEGQTLLHDTEKSGMLPVNIAAKNLLLDNNPGLSAIRFYGTEEIPVFQKKRGEIYRDSIEWKRNKMERDRAAGRIPAEEVFPEATLTPIPTQFMPTEEPTPLPSGEPLPSGVPVPVPTLTPAPSATPEPTVTATPKPTKKVTPTPKGYKVGDKVSIGTYETNNNTKDGKENLSWTVIAVEKDRVLLIADKVLATGAYSDKTNGTAWADSNLRSWLAEKFYSSAFTAKEKKKILLTDNTNPTNPECQKTNLEKNTSDYVFVLSIEEVEKYLTKDSLKKTKPTAYAKAHGVISSNGYSEWWLRTTGTREEAAATVYELGSINYQGREQTKSWVGIRPAMWISK